MVKVYYDLHIHTALSPCANDDMTPNDIVRMALLNGLDMIAITDHNSFSNAGAVIKAAQTAGKQMEKELIVLPGIEVSTAEEVHVLCLFKNLETALKFEKDLVPYLPSLLNRVDIFGRQILYDENDNTTGELGRMLIAPMSLSFDDLHSLTFHYGGAFIPAHIDRASFSVISNLGFLPPHLDIGTIEVSLIGVENGYDIDNKELYSMKNMIFSSDAHQLWDINEKKNYLMLPERNASVAIEFLR